HFFFSSRRRHTRWPRDWSSDVCSSDLSFDFQEFQGAYQRALTQNQLGYERAQGQNEAQYQRGLAGNQMNYARALTSYGTNLSRRSEERRVGKGCRMRWWTE